MTASDAALMSFLASNGQSAIDALVGGDDQWTAAVDQLMAQLG